MDNQKKLRIILNSNAPFATSGYSNQVAELLPLIQAEGYPLAMIDFFGLMGGKLYIDGVTHYPVINHTFGSDALVLHGRDFKADVSFTLQDVPTLHPHDLQQVIRWIPIIPIDHDPCPPSILQQLKFAYRIVTYSKFGHNELKKHGFYSTYIPHTVNTEIFKPMDKAERKKAAGFPEDSFVLGMVAANKENPPRKSFQEVMDAFVLFLKKVPKGILYLHTNPEFPGGFPAREYAKFLGIQDKVFFPDPYMMNFNLGKKEMALIYNTMDVLLMPSISEGFGIPAIESQACSVPVIVNNFTSMPELVKPGITGEVCELIGKRFSQQLSYMGVPSTQSIYDCLMKIYHADRMKMGEEARKFMVEEYDTQRVFEKDWKPFLMRLEREIYGEHLGDLQEPKNTLQ